MVYRFMRIIADLLLILPRRIRFYGRENIPRDGAVVLVSNHISALDPIVVGLAAGTSILWRKKNCFEGNFSTGSCIK